MDGLVKETDMTETIKTSRWQKPLLMLILALIHRIFDVLVQIWMFTSTSIKKFTQRHHNIQQDFNAIRNASLATLTKKPNHIAIALLEPKISLQEVAKLIVFCVASGSKGISLYDVKGFLKSYQNELKDHVKYFVKFLDQDIYLDWNKLSNQPEKGTTVCLLSREDGQADIVQAAKKVASNIANGNMNIEEVNEGLLEAYLGSSKGLPDPEILLRFGLSHSNQGYPPWQLRLSEIHDIDTHHGVSSRDFFNVLLKYSKCEQRFGQ